MAEGGREGQHAVLVVEADEPERERFRAWLEGSGFGVLLCPGPTEPEYTCVGARDGSCPLVAKSDLVVLDMSLDSEAVMIGTAAEELLGLYLMSGRPVVVLGSHPGEEFRGELRRLHRHPSREELVDALGALAEGLSEGDAVAGP
jgi:CheY-like chemotaxis protein